MKLRMKLALLVFLSFFSAVAFGAPWSSIKRIPVETNFSKFPQVMINKSTLSNYSSLVQPLFPNQLPISDIIFNKDMSRSLLVTAEGGLRMIFFDRDANILQEFSKINRRIFSAALSEKGDMIFFTSDRNIGDKKIYLAWFSNFAQDPNYELSFVVDSIGRSEFPSINSSGTKMAYQSQKDGTGPRIYVAEIGADHKIVSEDILTTQTQHAYFPRLSASGRYLLYYLKSLNGYQIIYADLQEKRLITLWDGAEVFSPYDINSEGDRVVFQSRDKLMNDVFLVDIKKNYIMNLSKRDMSVFGDMDAIDSEDSHITVSDDGTVVAYECQPRWDKPGIKVIDFRSKKTFFFYDSREFKRSPQVSRDGETLVYLVDGIRPMSVSLKKLREM